MRILHTSDWHLGRAFHGVGMLQHQARFLDHLLEVVESESVDLVVVAGDVYDRGLPPVDAVAVAGDAFARLARSRARVVVSSGNHDSARRLGFASELIDHAGLHLRTDAAQVGVPVVLDDEHGPVAVHAIPYLDPESIRRDWELPARSHEVALGAAMARIRADLTHRRSRSVVLAHAFVGGGQPSDSERDIAVGGISMVPPALFDGIDYVALGHLHGRQVLDERIRYSGSPLAYSFSESGHVKGSWLVDLGAPGDACDGSAALRAEFIPAPVPRPLARLRGELDTLLGDPAHAPLDECWLQVTLTDRGRPRSAMERLRTRFPHTLVVTYDSAASTGRPTRPPLAGRSDHAIALDFVSDVRGGPADAEESLLLREACEACAGDPEADVVVGC